MKYRKKPFAIEAVQYTGTDESKCEIYRFTNGKVHAVDADEKYIIPTLEGDMRASVGDYIIKGISGEFYPCKPDIFEKTYELVE